MRCAASHRKHILIHIAEKWLANYIFFLEVFFSKFFSCLDFLFCMVSSYSPAMFFKGLNLAQLFCWIIHHMQRLNINYSSVDGVETKEVYIYFIFSERVFLRTHGMQFLSNVWHKIEISVSFSCCLIIRNESSMGIARNVGVCGRLLTTKPTKKKAYISI